MSNVVRISVAIPAHNEEKTIRHILSDVFSQNEEGYTLEEVLVFCDGCSDKTAEVARTISDKRLKVIDDGKQMGQLQRMRHAIEIAKGEIISFFDADVRLDGINVLQEIASQFLSEDVVLVGGNTKPFPPTTFFERAVYTTFEVFERSRYELKGGNNIFGCTGGSISARRSFLESLTFPPLINNDDYLYFSCLKQGKKFRLAKKAVVFYKVPSDIKDHIKQMFRSSPTAVIENFTEYFGDVVAKEYSRPKLWLIKTILSVFFIHPLEVLFISLLSIIMHPFLPFFARGMKPVWETPKSTK
jgi:cellulose synthase/poly-beta-1,6-N-acetylglucosamine synthase-like glycosyltransferase